MNTPETSVRVASAGEAKLTGSTCWNRTEHAPGSMSVYMPDFRPGPRNELPLLKPENHEKCLINTKPHKTCSLKNDT